MAVLLVHTIDSQHAKDLRFRWIVCDETNRDYNGRVVLLVPVWVFVQVCLPQCSEVVRGEAPPVFAKDMDERRVTFRVIDPLADFTLLLFFESRLFFERRWVSVGGDYPRPLLLDFSLVFGGEPVSVQGDDRIRRHRELDGDGQVVP